MSKKYTTNFLQDTNGSTGSANQVLISTSSGVDWVDGSGSSIIGGPYLPLAGGTMTGNVNYNDNIRARFGTGEDFQVYHDGTDSYINNGNDGGNIYIQNDSVDKDIIFKSDNGSGGLATYFSLDGSQTNVNFQKDAIWADNKKALFGGSGDLQIYHDGSNSYIEDSGTGGLFIRAADSLRLQGINQSNFFIATQGSSVNLYYNNANKFDTTNVGVNVTGKISLSGKITGLTAGTANTDAVNVQQLNDATTGALIFKGTWSAASTTTGVHAAGSTSTAIVLENPNLGVSVGSTVTGTGIPAGTTVTAVLNSAAFSLSASITMTNGAVATFTTVGGIPDLSQTARKVTGDYYICETAGVATPNGASTTPNEWAIGDWVAFSDLATDAWQKIDNSSVLSGAGTGGSVAGWSGSGTSVTLQDAPITFNASNNTIVTGKLGIGSLNASFNLYNEGTSYFNGAATVDAAFTQTGGAASTFSGNVTVGAPTTNGGVINLIQSSTNPEIRIQSGESGASVFSIYNTAVDPDVEQFFINNTLGSSHLGNQRGALKLEDSEGVNLTLNSGNATFAGTVLSGGFLVGQTSQYAPTGGGNVLATLARADAARINSVISNQSSSADASAALVLATYGHDFFVKGTSLAGGSKLTLGFNTNPFLTLTSSLATFGGVLTGPSADLEFIKLTAANPGVLMKETDTTDKNWDIQLNSGNLKFYEVNDARSVFNQHVTFQAGGNVGIGVTGPSTTLEVAGHITINSPAGASQSSYGLRLRKTNSSSAVQAGGEILASPYPTNTNAGNLIFKTANASANLTQRMVIDGVGNVGIGTASPDTELHVKGGATVANFEGTGGSVFIGLKDSDDGTVGYMGVDGGKIKFQTSGSGYSDKLVIDTVGNVGIGTTTPTFKLHVDSNAASDNVAFIHHNNAAQSSGDVLKVRSDAGDNAGSALLNVQNNSGTALYVRGDRNVGVGTTSPAFPLDIVGFANSNSGFRVTDGTIDNRISWSSGNVGFFGTISNHPIAFNTNSIERMRITAAGDVLVGKTAVGVGTNGIELRANGLLAASRTGTSSNNVAYFNRNPDGGGNFGDGEVIQLRKNNTVVGVLGTEKWGIGTANPLKALHVVGDLQVTLAFYDSSVSAGASGQVLSSTATGTSWVDATAGSSFTPDVWQVNTADDLSTDDQTLICDTVQITNGTTNTTAAGGNAGEIRIVDAGTYEITYSVGIKVPTGIATRQVVAMYVGAAGTPIPGSLNSTYLRLPGSNQGGFTSLFNSSYITVSANTDISLIIGWLDGTNKSVDIYEPASVQNAISIRRIA